MDKTKFCKLEKDEKTFEYFKTYFQYFEDHDDSTLLDNEIQINEIKDHCNRHGISDQDLVKKWVKDNGEGERIYFNTIKIVYLVWVCSDKKWEDITWEEFCKIEDKINSLKSKCLDSIF